MDVARIEMSDALIAIDKVLTDTKPLVINTIKQYQWNLIPDTQLAAAKEALTKNDYIAKIAAGDPGAVHSALLKASILGLDLTEGKRQGWLLPRKTQGGKTVIQLQVGYKGVEAIHQRMGVIDRLEVRVVRENDAFDWSGDSQEKPTHKADWFKSEEERGAIIGAYAITYFPGGAIYVVTESVSKIYKDHRDIADSWKSYKAKIANGENAFPPPWVTFEQAMIEKTMAYIASKQWPANIRDESAASKIIETLHEVDTADYKESFTSYSASQKKAFDEMIEIGDGLGIYLVARSVDQQVYIDLFNSAPRGEKVAYKNKVRELEKRGVDVLTLLSDYIKDGDGLGFMENFEDAHEVTKKLYLGILNTDDLNTVNGFIEQCKENT